MESKFQNYSTQKPINLSHILRDGADVNSTLRGKEASHLKELIYGLLGQACAKRTRCKRNTSPNLRTISQPRSCLGTIVKNCRYGNVSTEKLYLTTRDLKSDFSIERFESFYRKRSFWLKSQKLTQTLGLVEWKYLEFKVRIVQHIAEALL